MAHLSSLGQRLTFPAWVVQSAATFSYIGPRNHRKSSSVTLAIWQPTVQMLVNDLMCKVLPIALKKRNDCEELAITTVVSGNLEELNAHETVSEERVSKILDVHVHVETYVPPTFGIWGNGVHLAVVGYGRNVAAAKYSDWVRVLPNLSSKLYDLPQFDLSSNQLSAFDMFLLGSFSPPQPSHTLVQEIIEKAPQRNDCEELAITTVVSGNLEELNAHETVSEERVSKILDVHVHVETYVPPTFGIWGNGVHLAVVGYGRNVAAAKYSDWERNSNDEKALCDYGKKYSFQVQTAPISDGVLPGTIRQLVLQYDLIINQLLALCAGYEGVKEFHFEKLLHHGQNVKSGRRHSSQVVKLMDNLQSRGALRIWPLFSPMVLPHFKHSRFKDDQHCSHRIAEVLDLDGKISPAQISNMLKRLGLVVAPRRKMCDADAKGPLSTSPNQLDGDKITGATNHKSVNLEGSLLIQGPRRCSYMIANALDKDGKFTTAQVS
ncbi:hypothetical protein JHK84_031365 [Glycine max]|nr:hypothetical protein JHK84_031365 [Glycine max]